MFFGDCARFFVQPKPLDELIGAAENSLSAYLCWSCLTKMIRAHCSWMGLLLTDSLGEPSQDAVEKHS